MSDTFNAACPHCRKPLVLSRAHLGVSVRCGHCQGVLRIAAPPPPQAIPVAAPVPPPAVSAPVVPAPAAIQAGPPKEPLSSGSSFAGAIEPARQPRLSQGTSSVGRYLGVGAVLLAFGVGVTAFVVSRNRDRPGDPPPPPPVTQKDPDPLPPKQTTTTTEVPRPTPIPEPPSAPVRWSTERKLGKKGICDLCSAGIGPDAPVYTPEQMREAVKKGLRPPEQYFKLTGLFLSREEAVQGWISQVMRDRTDWAFCPECAEKLENRLKGKSDELLRQMIAKYAQARELMEKGKGKEAAPLYDEIAELAERAIPNEHNIAPFVSEAAVVHHKVGNFEKAQKYYQRVLPLLVRRQQLLEASKGPESLETAIILENDGELHLLMDEPERAEPLLRRVLAIREKKIPDDAASLTRACHNLGSAYLKLKRYDGAEPLLRRSHELAEKEGKVDDLRRERIAEDLGKVYLEKEKFAEAEPLLLRALEIREKARGPDHHSLEDLVRSLSLVALKLNRNAQAATYSERLARIKEKQLGSDSLEHAEGLYYQAGLLELRQEFGKSEELYRRCLKIRQQKLGPRHPEVARVLVGLGTLCLRSGAYPRAAEHLEQACAMLRERNTPELLPALNSLGQASRLLGRYQEAETAYKEALAFAQKNPEVEGADQAVTLSNLGVLYQTTGRLPQAESMYLKALALLEEKLGKENLGVAPTLSSLGGLYEELGQPDRAEQYLLRALKIREKVDPGDPAVAITLDNLSALDISRDRYDLAEERLRRALKIREDRLGADHPTLAVTLHNLAQVAAHKGDHDQALKMQHRALDIARSRLGPDHPRVGETSVYLAATYLHKKEYDEAEKHLLNAKKILEARQHEDHPSRLIVANFLSDLYGLTARWDLAARSVDQSHRFLRRRFSRLLPVLAEADQQAQLARYRDNSTHLSLGVVRRQDPAIRDRSAEWVLNYKGVIQEALAERTLLLRERADSEARKVWEKLLSLRAQLANLTVQAEKAPDPARLRAEIKRLSEEETELARELARLTGRPAEGDRWVELTSVRKALPRDAVLVEIASFYLADYKSNRARHRHYAAWIIPAEGRGDVQVIDLGEASELEQLVRRTRQELQEAGKRGGTIFQKGEGDAEADLRKSLDALSARVLHPLEPHLAGASHWLVSPDAALWLVPWSALTLKGGGYVVEKHTVRHIATGRDVLAAPRGSKPGQAVVVADPDFDLAPEKAFREGTNSQRSGSLQERNWSRLFGTADEARAILPKLKRYLKEDPVLHSGEQALESRIKGVDNPRVLIASTHAFFLEDPWHDEEGKLSIEAVLRSRPRAAENPLLRCGLVLAGANRRDAREGRKDDGILTGLEVVGMDLRGTELVVLSACDSGVGKLNNGEGVAGLRQAFQLAGAQAVLASLWKVDDRETATLMASFWEQRAAGLEPADALREAQRAYIKARRAAEGAAHPYYWAAFSLTGSGK